MAVLSVDGWALHSLALDFADQFVADALIANGADAHGRGIDLRLTRDGAALDCTGMACYLLWRHDALGVQGQEAFEAVDASAGRFKVYYPPAMLHGGTVTARISVYAGSEQVTGSRNFKIHVERNPVDESQAMADDDFSAFVQATIDLNELEASVEAAEALRVTAETGRANAETARVSAEAGRVSAEGLRATAETGRSNAESARAQAETGRANAETARANEFAALKGQSQDATAAANAAAADAREAAEACVAEVLVYYTTEEVAGDEVLTAVYDLVEEQ